MANTPPSRQPHSFQTPAATVIWFPVRQFDVIINSLWVILVKSMDVLNKIIMAN